MSALRKDILLVSYIFPPYYGIGGRRWAKHADALTKLGYTIHVISAKNPFIKKSLWTGIIENNPQIITHQLPSMFPKVLVSFKHNSFQKLLYRFWTVTLPLITRGSYLDRTIFWKGIMTRKAKEVITENKITNVICSGGPFGVMHRVTELKNWHKDLFIINDLRDPWTWGPNWGFPNLPPKRMEYEQKLEAEMVKNSDLVTVPTVELKRFLDKKYPLYEEKIKVLCHFFDSSEIIVADKTKSKKLRLLLYGSIYHHIPELIEETAHTISHYKDDILLDIYTDKTQYKYIFEKYGAENVKFHEQIPAKELFKIFKNYDYIYFMIPGVGVDHISTKFYEVIYSKTPFLIFCKDGMAPQFVVENRLGIHAKPDCLNEVFRQLVTNKIYKNYNADFNLSDYSIENNAKQIESYLK